MQAAGQNTRKLAFCLCCRRYISWILQTKELYLKPFNNINSKNLALLLFLARTFAYMGFILFFVAVVLFVYMTLTSDASIIGAQLAISLFPVSLSILVVSSLLAAIAAFEESYRLRTEHIVNKNEI